MWSTKTVLDITLQVSDNQPTSCLDQAKTGTCRYDRTFSAPRQTQGPGFRDTLGVCIGEHFEVLAEKRMQVNV